MASSWKSIYVPAMLVVLVLLAACISIAAGGSSKSDIEPFGERFEWADGYVVVLGSGKDFAAVEKSAKRIAKKSRIRYDRMDRSFTNPDFGWWGRLARDGDQVKIKPFVSVEYSSVYKLKTRFVVVGAVTDTLAEARIELARYRKTVPDAYIKKFRQYMGCRQ